MVQRRFPETVVQTLLPEEAYEPGLGGPRPATSEEAAGRPPLAGWLPVVEVRPARAVSAAPPPPSVEASAQRAPTPDVLAAAVPAVALPPELRWSGRPMGRARRPGPGPPGWRILRAVVWLDRALRRCR